MRPTPSKYVGGNLMEKQRLEEAVGGLLNEWEIQCLILVSFGLQVFLLLAAGTRRRSTSRVLQALLWLAYLSADSVAIFVLGHLAVHASGAPQHQLLFFWAPFVLLHLGGQETITAFSMEDSELWRRHLLSLVTQVAVAAYVVSRSSWPDRRLLAAMVLMFVSGCFKYTERTLCLFLSSRDFLGERTLHGYKHWAHVVAVYEKDRYGANRLELTLHRMLGADGSSPLELTEDINYPIQVIMLDAPANDLLIILAADALPALLQGLRPSADHRRAYYFVATQLRGCYDLLYTKSFIRLLCIRSPGYTKVPYLCSPAIALLILLPFLSTSTALVLFIATEKGHLYSKVDVTVSYILLIGAIILEIPSLSTSIVYSRIIECAPRMDRIRSAMSRATNYICRKQSWSKMIAQYSMISKHLDDNKSLTYIPSMISKHLDDKRSLTYIPISEDLEKSVLHKLLDFGIGDKQDWNFASFRGQPALRKWMDSRNSVSASSGGTCLHKSIHDVDFPTSVLIWHIATDVCYVGPEDSTSTTTTTTDQIKKMSRELSRYIMYLVFKSGMRLTTTTEILHINALEEMKENLGPNLPSLAEKEAIRKVFEVNNYGHQPFNTDNSTSSGSLRVTQLQLVRSTMKALDSPVLPRASAVARELIAIDEEADSWDLIFAVWLEMLYYIAPRCGGAFHTQHLSTGGEFITHVLLLMYNLGPFLPPPGDLASGH